MIGDSGAAGGVEDRHRIGDGVSRECEDGFVHDHDRDLAVRDRLTAVVLDLNIDLRLAAGCERFLFRLGGDRQFSRFGRYREIDVAAGEGDPGSRNRGR